MSNKSFQQPTVHHLQLLPTKILYYFYKFNLFLKSQMFRHLLRHKMRSDCLG